MPNAEFPDPDQSGDCAPIAAVVVDSAAVATLDGTAARSLRGAFAALRRRGAEVETVHSDGGHPASLNDVLHALDHRGVGPGLVLVIAEPDSAVGRAAAGIPRLRQLGASEALGAVRCQLRMRRGCRVPAIDEDPAWVLRDIGADPLRHRITESLFTVGAGGIATRGTVEESDRGAVPLVLAAGVYCGDGAEQHLLAGPEWTGLALDPPPADNIRTLDLRTGVLHRAEPGRRQVFRSGRFGSPSIARPGVVAMRAEATPARLRAGRPLRESSDGPITTHRSARQADDSPADGAGRRHRGRGRATHQTRRFGTDGRAAGLLRGVLDRPTAGRESQVDAGRRGRRGLRRVVAEHRAAWAARWDVVGIRIPDDPAAELAVRFALFHLWGTADRHDELAVGARGLSGSGYWRPRVLDADAFVLPALVSIDPRAARAMLRYRLRRLPAALERARAEGYSGARFPWESAASGADVTPTEVASAGQIVPIETGQREEHVTADVAWAADRYLTWTAERPPPSSRRCWWRPPGTGHPAVAWTQGSGHIDHVIGPDEYHECIDDNAYTNVMARWNLRAGADAADRAGRDAEEGGAWRELADRVVDGYDPTTGWYEQFAGYFDLAPALIADVALPPVAADVLLGRDRVRACS